MWTKAIRGAITVTENSANAIDAATKELLAAIITENKLKPSAIYSAFFTVTIDLNATFPAKSARDIGWGNIPMMCSTEIPVPGALAQCIRVMVMFNTLNPFRTIKHQYLREAAKLRPDIAEKK